MVLNSSKAFFNKWDNNQILEPPTGILITMECNQQTQQQFDNQQHVIHYECKEPEPKPEPELEAEEEGELGDLGEHKEEFEEECGKECCFSFENNFSSTFSNDDLNVDHDDDFATPIGNFFPSNSTANSNDSYTTTIALNERSSKFKKFTMRSTKWRGEQMNEQKVIQKNRRFSITSVSFPESIESSFSFSSSSSSSSSLRNNNASKIVVNYNNYDDQQDKLYSNEVHICPICRKMSPSINDYDLTKSLPPSSTLTSVYCCCLTFNETNTKRPSSSTRSCLSSSASASSSTSSLYSLRGKKDRRQHYPFRNRRKDNINLRKKLLQTYLDWLHSLYRQMYFEDHRKNISRAYMDCCLPILYRERNSENLKKNISRTPIDWLHSLYRRRYSEDLGKNLSRNYINCCFHALYRRRSYFGNPSFFRNSYKKKSIKCNQNALTSWKSLSSCYINSESPPFYYNRTIITSTDCGLQNLFSESKPTFRPTQSSLPLSSSSSVSSFYTSFIQILQMKLLFIQMQFTSIKKTNYFNKFKMKKANCSSCIVAARWQNDYKFFQKLKEGGGKSNENQTTIDHFYFLGSGTFSSSKFGLYKRLTKILLSNLKQFTIAMDMSMTMTMNMDSYMKVASSPSPSILALKKNRESSISPSSPLSPRSISNFLHLNTTLVAIFAESTSLLFKFKGKPVHHHLNHHDYREQQQQCQKNQPQTLSFKSTLHHLKQHLIKQTMNRSNNNYINNNNNYNKYTNNYNNNSNESSSRHRKHRDKLLCHHQSYIRLLLQLFLSFLSRIFMNQNKINHLDRFKSKKLQQQQYIHKIPKLSYSKLSLVLLSFLMPWLPLTIAQASILGSSSSLSTLTSSNSVRLTPSSSSSSVPGLMYPPSLSSTKENKTVTLAKREQVCKSMDLRNFERFNDIANCTVIEGFLLMGLMISSNEPTPNLSYPLLTEVTEFVMVHRLQNIRSLGQLFPNLAIIRGRELFEGYSLIIFSNPVLEEIGLTKLIAIERGGVVIRGNNRLCYANTIDWKRIVHNSTEKIDIFSNRNEGECQQCPGNNNRNEEGVLSNEVGCNLHNGKRHCWNGQACQIVCPPECPNNCHNSTLCCDEACVGGCTTNPRECTACRNYSIHNTTCISSCPADYFQYLGRRCVTGQDCLNIGHKFQNSKQEILVTFNKTCSTDCPHGYEKRNSTCVPCYGDCHKKCKGGEVDSVARAKEFYGCTEIVERGLTISIKLGGPHAFKELEYGFGAIKVIHTFLKIQRTYSIPSLGFFKNLRNITGAMLEDGKFALYVLENNDLEKLWNDKQEVYINSGRVFFHFNPKLCYSVIEAIRPMMRFNATFDKNEVATDSNGSRGSCNTTLLILREIHIKNTMIALEIVNPMKFPDERTLIGYQFFYKEAPSNVTKHSYSPCDDSWTVTDPKKTQSIFINNLEPFTRYAFYVKTMTISSEPRNGESDIIYYKTLPFVPQKVRNLAAFSNSSSEIVVTWDPPNTFNGDFDLYIVIAKEVKTFEIEIRNYCDLHLLNVDPVTPKSTEKPQTKPTDGTITDDNCNCGDNGKTGTLKNKNLDETYDVQIHKDIDFENALQNFVYVKNPNADNATSKKRRPTIEGYPEESLLVRFTRDLKSNHIDDKKLKVSSSGNDTTNAKEKSTSSLKGNSTSNSNSNSSSIIENQLFSVEAKVNNNGHVFRGLEHFKVYSVVVRACRKRVPNESNQTTFCGDDAIKEVRTLKLENVDKVRNVVAFQVPINSTNYGSARVKWDPPEKPNGRVISYTIRYMKEEKDEAFDVKCINITQYNKTSGYELVKLTGGNYSVRVRANSLAGEGIYSEKTYFDIILPKMGTGTILIIVGCVIAVFAILGTVAFFMRKRLSPAPDLKIFPSVNPYYLSTPYLPDEWEVPRERIIQLGPLGQGSFGMVYEGILKGREDDENSLDTSCAIKTVNESATDRERIKFLDEASVMKQFNTHHVVRLLGVCSAGQPALVVMELMKKGDLKTYLRQHRPENNRDETVLSTFAQVNMPEPPPSLDRIFLMAIQIADGMAYLAAKKFVHRDLAARNCMVANDLTVKIGDFGMTRDIYETDYYRKGTKGLLPVRWMAPESLKDGVYSSASDVFSYGVVLWEMATLAAQPYQGLSNDQVLRYVIDGGVMERPENCPDPLYNLMQKCWHHRPTARPTFLEIIHLLYDYADDAFEAVSFYNSPTGRQQLIKERNEMYITDDQDNTMDDATTPLHVGDFSGYKMNLGNQSSVENIDESPIITAEDEDEHLHSPNSMVSGIAVNSASDGQSKNSFNLSHKLHGGGGVGGGSNSGPPQYSSDFNLQQQRQQPFQQYSSNRPSRQSFQLYNTGNLTIGNVTDNRGYEVYDPSPNYREHGGDSSYDNPDEDDEDDEMEGKLLRPGQHLLPIAKNGNKRQPQIMGVSMSMPDETSSGGNVPMISSSLHPSTASAASSNTSSTIGAGGGGTSSGATGKFQSLKDAAAESLMPRFRFRNIFNNKRSNSNNSHKNSGSNTNKNYHQAHQNVSGGSVGGVNTYTPHALSTIESGGSGSAGSYTAATPPNKKTTPTTTTSISTNSNNSPGYKPLDESINISGISAVSSTPYSQQHSSLLNPKPSASAASSSTLSSTLSSSIQPKVKPIPLLNLTTSTNPNYQFLDNSNTSLTAPATGAGQKNNTAVVASNLSSGSSTIPFREISDNPNYVMMTDPSPPTLPSPSSYVLPSTSWVKLYQDETKTNQEDPFMENIKMTPLIQTQDQDRDRDRDREAQGESQQNLTLKLKEKWFKDQQYQKHKLPPPPNGFVGPESS